MILIQILLLFKEIKIDLMRAKVLHNKYHSKSTQNFKTKIII